MLPYEKLQSYPCWLTKGSKLSTLLSSRRYVSVHFHHVVRISINYCRGENSTTWKFSTETLSTQCSYFNTNSSASVHTQSTIQLCGCVIFFVVAGKLILYELSCSIRIFFFFWFWREIVFGVTYVLSVQYNCAVVSFFLLWRES